MTRLAANFRLLLRRVVRVPASDATATTRRRVSRRALIWGLFAFGLFTFALALAAETAKPEWRDPEYGHRLRQVQRWQQKRPNRPLVLFAGSSRTQYGVSPSEMDFPDEPGSPLVYNFGYRGAHALGVWLQVSRLLDAGVKPRVALIQLASTELRTHGSADDLYVLSQQKWGVRFTPIDAKRLEPFINDRKVFERAIFAARLNPWESRREAIVSDLLTDWQTPLLRAHHDSWEQMDRYGYRPLRTENVRIAEFKAGATVDLKNHPFTLACPIGDTANRALRLLITHLRERGIIVGLYWMPESPTYRKLYTTEGRAIGENYAKQLAREYGLTVFPAPEDLSDDDFSDGYHLLNDGAVKYSRWLAENHLKRWLTDVLK